MSIKLKTKNQAKAVESTETPEVESVGELVDRVGTLQLEADAVKKKIALLGEQLKPYKEALAKLQTEVDAMDIGDDETTEVRGDKFRLEVGKRGTSRSIKDLPKVFEFMGEDVFTQVATVPLKAIDDYLTPPQKEEVLNVERTSRSVKVVQVSED